VHIRELVATPTAAAPPKVQRSSRGMATSSERVCHSSSCANSGDAALINTASETTAPVNSAHRISQPGSVADGRVVSYDD